MRLRLPGRRDTLGKDAMAGFVLGVESVPDGLAAGLLAGVSPLSGLYAYLFGTVGGSLFTSSAFMAVQATGAMAIVIADVPAVHSANDSARALFTLSVLTGVAMLAAGFFRLGSMLRFVSNTVMVGFISAVGVNIILGQLASLTGYKAAGANRVIRAINTVIHPGELHRDNSRARISSVTEKKPPRCTRSPKTRATTSRTRNLLPNRTAHRRTAAAAFPVGVEAWRNRAFTRFLAATTISRTTLSRTAVSKERVKVSLITLGRYSTNRFRTTT